MMLYYPGDSIDYHFVTNRVATGGAIHATSQVEYLKSKGITHVINCRDEFDDSALFTPESTLEYLWIGAPDDGKTKDPEWFGRALDFAMPALSKPGNKIYAHCYAGINRGPSIAYAILRAQGLDRPTAFRLIREVRSQAWIVYADDADLAIDLLGYE